MREDAAHVSMRVPFAASSVAVVRSDLRAWLRSRETSNDTVDDARVVISELVGNAVRHAQPLPDGCLVVAWDVEERGTAHLGHRRWQPDHAAHGRRTCVGDLRSRACRSSRPWSASGGSRTRPTRTTVHALMDL